MQKDQNSKLTKSDIQKRLDVHGDSLKKHLSPFQGFLNSEGHDWNVEDLAKESLAEFLLNIQNENVRSTALDKIDNLVSSQSQKTDRKVPASHDKNAHIMEERLFCSSFWFRKQRIHVSQ